MSVPRVFRAKPRQFQRRRLCARPCAIRYLSPDSVAVLVPAWQPAWVEVADGAVIGRAQRRCFAMDEWELRNRGP